MCQRFNNATLETMPSISDPTLFIGGISPSTAYKTMAYILLLQEIGDLPYGGNESFRIT